MLTTTFRPRRRRLWGVALFALPLMAWADPAAETAPPPRALSLPEPGYSRSAQRGEGALDVDISDRAAVHAFYHGVYLASEGIDAGWTGDVATCTAGDIAADYREAMYLRINYFRAMAGVWAGVIADPVKDAKCMEAALMMIAEGRLSHCVSAGSCDDFECYTADAAEAAKWSNLAIGTTGPAAIDGQMEDPGGGNYFVGHRRWLLYPPQSNMGAGATTHQNGGFRGSTAVWVIGGSNSSNPPPVHGYVAWPPPGYVPYQVVFPRWSFSIHQADFSATTVAMTTDGQPIDLSVNDLLNDVGYAHNTIVWEPEDLSGLMATDQDIVIDVMLTNVGTSAGSEDFSYQVILTNPEAIPPTPTPTPTPTPSPTPVEGDPLPAVLGDVHATAAHDFNQDSVVDAADVVIK